MRSHLRRADAGTNVSGMKPEVGAKNAGWFHAGLILFALVFGHGCTPETPPGDTISDAAARAESIGSDVYPKRTYAGVEALFARYRCAITRRNLNGDLDADSVRKWSRFRTRIREGATRTVNFGGRFVIVEWGCGTSCQSGAAIDLSDGKIYELPVSEWSREYRAESTLLIVNPPSRTPSENDRPEFGYPAYYVWQPGDFQLLFDTRDMERDAAGDL